MAAPTKATLAAAFSDQQPAAAGSNGTATPEAAPAETFAAVSLPPIQVEEPAVELPPKVFGKQPKPAPAPAGAQARLNRILPDANRILIYKRTENGKQAFIGDYDANEIQSAGGWQVFIRRYLKDWLDAGANFFRIDSTDQSGNTRSHGEHAIMGDPPGRFGATPIPSPFPAAAPARDAIEDTERLEALNERRRAAIRAEQEAERQRIEKLEAQIAKATEGGGVLAAVLPLLLRQQTPPARDPRDEAEYIDSRVQRALQPIASVMDRMAARLESLASAGPPAAPPTPPDPLVGVTQLLAAIKPTTPPGPTMAEIQIAITQAVAANKPREEFSMKDWLMMQSQETDRRERAIAEERQRAERERDRVETQAREDRQRTEQALERRISELKEGRSKDGISSAIETIKAVKDAAGLFSDQGGGEGIGGLIVQAITDEGLWHGIATAIDAAKGKGAEEGDENEEIEVDEAPAPRPQPRPQPAPAAARPAPAAAPPPAAKPSRKVVKAKPVAPSITPADLATDDYPAGFDEMVAQLAPLAAQPATEPPQIQAQVMAVNATLQFCAKHSPIWDRRLRTALHKVCFGSPQEVTTWFGAFVRGLSKNGKLPLGSVENLEQTLTTHAKTIAAYVRKVVRESLAAAKAKKTGAPAAPAETQV